MGRSVRWREIGVMVAVTTLTGCGGGGDPAGSPSGDGTTSSGTASATTATTATAATTTTASTAAADGDPVKRIEGLADAIAKASGAQGAVYANTNAAGDRLSLAVATAGKVTIWEAAPGTTPAAKAAYPAEAPVLSVRPVASWPWNKLVAAARSAHCDKPAVLNSWATRGEAVHSVVGCPAAAGATTTRISVFLDDHLLGAIADPFSAASVKELLWEAKVTMPKGRAQEVELGDMRGQLAMTVTPASGPDGLGRPCPQQRWRRSRDYTKDSLFASPSGCGTASSGTSATAGGPAFDVGAVSPDAVSAALAEVQRRLGAPLSQAMSVRLVQVNGRVCVTAVGGMPYHEETVPLGTAGA